MFVDVQASPSEDEISKVQIQINKQWLLQNVKAEDVQDITLWICPFQSLLKMRHFSPLTDANQIRPSFRALEAFNQALVASPPLN